MITQNKEDNLFIKQICDKDKQCQNRNVITCTGFLDTHEQALVFDEKKNFTSSCCLWGGYEEAERKILFFLPDYLDEPPADSVSILKAEFSPAVSLSHKDFLGSACGLGIKRENIGDILISDNFAQIFIKPEMESFFLSNYEKAGRQNLKCRIIFKDELILPNQSFDYSTVTVSSMRADCILSGAYKVSRSEAVKLIEQKRVFVNDVIVTKSDKPLCLNDKIKVVKLGKVIICEVGGTSKKGRIFVTFRKYI